MANYDLTGSLEKDFTFNLNDEKYVFRKPTVREMRALAKKFAGIEKETDPDVQSAKSEEAMQELYTYIQPLDNARPVAEALEDQPMGAQIAFNDMIQIELGAKK
jgi:hypothetical protein